MAPGGVKKGWKIRGERARESEREREKEGGWGGAERWNPSRRVCRVIGSAPSVAVRRRAGGGGGGRRSSGRAWPASWPDPILWWVGFGISLEFSSTLVESVQERVLYAIISYVCLSILVEVQWLLECWFRGLFVGFEDCLGLCRGLYVVNLIHGRKW